MTDLVAQLPMDEIAELCRRFHVSELAIFGSALREDFTPDSDIDLLVTYEPEARISLFKHLDLQDELARVVGREVDLISKRGLKPRIRDSVIGSARVIYA